MSIQNQRPVSPKPQEAVLVTLSAWPHYRDYVALVKAIDNGIDRSWSTRVGLLASGKQLDRHHVVHPVVSKVLHVRRRSMLTHHLPAVQDRSGAGCSHRDGDIRQVRQVSPATFRALQHAGVMGIM